jgi:hypothetical protein
MTSEREEERCRIGRDFRRDYHGGESSTDDDWA